MNKDIEKAGAVLHLLLNELEERIVVGATGNELNDFAEYALKCYCPKVHLSCKNYRGFPKSICVSINEGIIHGVPDNRLFVEGDVIKVDIVLDYNGWYADSARTVICGEGSYEDKRLVKICKECLYKGIAVARNRWTVGDIGYAIQRHAESNGYSVMRDYSGHFIGKSIHLSPSIPCFGKKRDGYKLKEGDLLCIEPMVFAGSPEIIKLKDSWTVKSRDNSMTSHFEHTVEIQRKGLPIIIT